MNPFKKPKARDTLPKPVELPAYTPPPPPEPVTAVPDEDAIRKKQKKALQLQQQKSGRASTFLSDNEGFLG